MSKTKKCTVKLMTKLFWSAVVLIPKVGGDLQDMVFPKRKERASKPPCGEFKFLSTVIYMHVLHIQFSLMYDFLRKRTVFSGVQFSLFRNLENK